MQLTNPRYHFPRKPVADHGSVVSGDRYRFTILTEGLLRYEYAEDGIFEDRASTFVINRHLPVPKFRVVDDGHTLSIDTNKYHLTYDKKPFSQVGLSVQVKGNITDWKSKWRYGGGIKEELFYLHGTARTLDEADGRIPLGPGAIARNGYAELDDSDSFLFSDDGWVTGRREAPEGTKRIDGYLFAYGLDYRAAMKAFYAVSGSQPLLPRWSLGNWWSRYYAYTSQSYLDLIDRFHREGLPFSVGVLDMDWHLIKQDVVKKSGLSGWTGYTWDKDLFPHPKHFLEQLHKRGLKICPNDHPADGVASYEDQYKEMAEALGKDPESGDTIPFDIASKPFNDAYFDILLKAREKEGIDFWWVDWQQGPYSSVPGVDPLTVLNHFHFLNNSRDNTRPLTFSRFFGPGSHRYPVGFSGDTIVTWESLNFQPEFTATSANIGFGWWSHDIGGHTQGYRDDELATRWVQYGVFSPILRLHSSNNVWNSKEPWRFIPEAREAMNQALRLRHKLMPYLYSCNVLSARENEPLVQPIYWHHPERYEAYKNKNTYFFGPGLFVAPMTSPRDKITRKSKTQCWLTPGRHIDIFSSMVYDGDRQVSFHRGLDEYAVLAPEGAIIPFDAAHTPANGCPNPKALEVKVVVGKDGHFKMYEDDGTGSSLASVDLISTPIKWQQDDAVFTIGPASTTDPSIPSKRDWTVTFLGLPHDLPKNISFSLGDGTWSNCLVEYNQKGVGVVIPDVRTTHRIEISLGVKNPQLEVNDPLKRSFPIIDHAQMSYDMKKRLWDILKSERSVSVKVGDLMALDVPLSLKEAVSEVMLADERSYA